jgi:adenosylcobinamide-GDP ribazoletransferase
MKKILARIAAALSFLTVLPVPGAREVEHSAAFYPIAGWVIGGALYGILTAAGGLPALARAFIAVAVWELASRGLHADGLADTADGFIAGGDRSRILRILDDSHTGAFGILAIVLIVTGKIAFLSGMALADARAAAVCACVVGRFGLTALAWAFPAAQEEGLGSQVINSTAWYDVAVAAVIAFVPLGLWFGMHALYAACGLVLGFLLALYSWRKIGGLTGDVLGAGLELTELAVLFTFLVS